MGKVKLTERQREILRWIDTRPHNHSCRGSDQSLILGGTEGTICIAWEDNQALAKMVEPNPDNESWRDRHFALTDLGRSALADEGSGRCLI